MFVINNQKSKFYSYFLTLCVLLPTLTFSDNSFTNRAYIKFYSAIHDGFVSGQFVCTEVNEYGTMDYACGGKMSDGSIRSIPANTEIKLPDDFLNPYHDPTKLKILSVYIRSFQGQIQSNGEKMISCQFPDEALTDHTHARIILTEKGTCKIKN